MTLEAYEELLKSIQNVFQDYLDTGYLKYYELTGNSPQVEVFRDLLARVNRKIVHDRAFDSFTGLLMKNVAETVIEEILTKPESLRQSFCFALIDIDQFRRFNDYFGLPNGDRIIIEVAKQLKSSFGPQYWITRTAGDQFLVIFDLPLSQSKFLIENFHDNYSARQLEGLGNKPTIRIVLTDVRQGDTMTSLFRRLEDVISGEGEFIKSSNTVTVV